MNRNNGHPGTKAMLDILEIVDSYWLIAVDDVLSVADISVELGTLKYKESICKTLVRNMSLVKLII